MLNLTEATGGAAASAAAPPGWASALLGSLGTVPIPTYIGYGVMIVLLYRTLRASARVVSSLETAEREDRPILAQLAALERRTQGDLAGTFRDEVGRVSRCVDRGASPFRRALERAVHRLKARMPLPEVIEAHIRGALRTRLGPELNRLTRLETLAPTAGLIFTMFGIAMGAWVLSGGGGQSDLLQAFAVAIGTSILGHFTGDRAGRALGQARQYEEQARDRVVDTLDLVLSLPEKPDKPPRVVQPSSTPSENGERGESREPEERAEERHVHL